MKKFSFDEKKIVTLIKVGFYLAVILAGLFLWYGMPIIGPTDHKRVVVITLSPFHHLHVIGKIFLLCFALMQILQIDLSKNNDDRWDNKRPDSFMLKLIRPFLSNNCYQISVLYAGTISVLVWDQGPFAPSSYFFLATILMIVFNVSIIIFYEKSLKKILKRIVNISRILIAYIGCVVIISFIAFN